MVMSAMEVAGVLQSVCYESVKEEEGGQEKEKGTLGMAQSG